jgi:hypothetical protein
MLIFTRFAVALSPTTTLRIPLRLLGRVLKSNLSSFKVRGRLSS